MNFRILEFNEARNLITRGWIPSEYEEELEDLYVFGGFDEDTILCAAVFSDNFTTKLSVEFKYIYVHRDYRGRGISKELYAYCEAAFMDINMLELFHRCIIEKEYGALRVHLMQAYGFLPMYIDRRVLRYERGHFRGDKADLLYDNIHKLHMTIETIENYSDRRLITFMEKKDTTGIYLNREEYDPNMCAFVIMNDKIEAALCLKVYDATSIIVEGYYVSDRIQQQDQLLPFLLSYLVKKNETDNRNYASFRKLYAVCKQDYRADAITKNFGEAIEEYFQQKYVKKLRR